MLELEMDKRTTGEYAADELRAAIMSGQIADDTEISQVEIARGFGLSRMPVREALIQLEGEGLIERLDNRHTRVIGVNQEVCASRFILMTTLMELALGSISPDAIEPLLSDWRTCPQRSQEVLSLYDRILTASPDRFLRQIYRRVFSGFFAYSLKNMNPLPSSALIEQALGSAMQRNRAQLHRALQEYYAQVQAALSEG